MTRSKSIYLVLFAILLSPIAANATFIFSNASYTSNSITFTIDGDMTGYAQPDDTFQFSLQFLGDIWSGPTTPGSFTANTWSDSVFDGLSIVNQGNTGLFYPGQIIPYSWSIYGVDLGSATATNRTVTIATGNYFNTSAINPLVSFVWGNGCTPDTICPGTNQDFFTVLGQTNFASVPEPGTLALLGIGLLGMAAARRRKKV